MRIAYFEPLSRAWERDMGGFLFGRPGEDWFPGVDEQVRPDLVSARLAAVEAWLAVRGELPLNVLFVVEGEEEIGSLNLGAFAEAHRDKLQADGCVWETGYNGKS